MMLNMMKILDENAYVANCELAIVLKDMLLRESMVVDW